MATLKLLGELAILFGVGIRIQIWADRHMERQVLLRKSKGLAGNKEARRG